MKISQSRRSAWKGGPTASSLSFPPFFPPIPPHFPSFSPLPLGPALVPTGRSGEHCRLPSEGRVKAPVTNNLVHIWTKKSSTRCNSLWIFLRTKVVFYTKHAQCVLVYLVDTSGNRYKLLNKSFHYDIRKH